MNFQRSEWFQQSMQETLEIDQEKGMAWKSANQLADEVVEGLLFKDEVELAGDGVEGSGAFARAFVAAGVKTESDKSLRDFRLYARIFKYRCSYMIYSKAFKGLPPLVKERVLVKLRAALSEESDEKFNYLSSREKKSIRAILEETLPDFSGQ